MGTPTIALGSIPKTVLIRSLKRFTAINVIATMCPQRVRRLSPTAAAAQDTEAAKSSTQTMILCNLLT